MSDSDGNGLTDGVWDSVYKWGTSWAEYAQLQLQSLLSPGDLEVIDPDSNEAQKAGDLLNPDDKRQQMWSSLEQYIGRDVMSLMSVPVWIMEPFTVLQKMAEIMEYADLLDKANGAKDPIERLAYVTAFGITPYGAIERPWKPFNPILGETFELECGNQIRFLAEQVSHHPPIGAAHAENENFIYDIVSAPKTKFLGNSAEIYPCGKFFPDSRFLLAFMLGRTRITLKSTGESFSIIPPTSKVCNLIIGSTWIDTFGSMSIINITTGTNGNVFENQDVDFVLGDRSDLDFTPCGWFGAGRYEFNGVVTEKSSGLQKAKFSGLWNAHCDVTFADDTSNTVQHLWKCADKPANDVYGRTYFCYKCSSAADIIEPLLTDSRRRPDVCALDKSDNSEAAKWKHCLEEMQRAEKRQRIVNKETWQPRWFTPTVQDDTIEGEYSLEEVPSFEWNGDYFKRQLGTQVEDPETVVGNNFTPWKYPNLHTTNG